VPFQAVTSQRLYQQVAAQIADLVASGELKPGDRLPAERELSLRLGVSRPTVREAMIALELAGLVEVRVGAGATVLARPGGDRALMRLADAGAGPVELVRARLVIEPEVAAEAARNATPGQIAALNATLDAMRAAPDSSAHRAIDRQFHRLIAEATGNAVLATLVEGLWREMFSPLFERMGRLSGLIPNEHTATLAQHAAVAKAIAAHDPAAARAAMQAHLRAVERIIGGDDIETGDAA